MPNQVAPRQVVQGVHILLLKNRPYIEVAERVRLVHKVGKPFSFDRGEVLRICNRWIYRAYVTIDHQQYIGDAEIHFGSPPNTPDGTNPITCGQTSAVGNALTFAGFGEVKSALARLGQSLEREVETSPDSSRRMIQGVEVVMLNDEPYVTVAERIYFVHLTGKAFSIQQCKILRYNTVWVYRAFCTIDGQRYIGDAEVYFDALHDPDRTYPVSCGQTSAVGNALAIAGFGDVRSILERQGKDVPDTLEVKPLLASADATIRALQRADKPENQEREQQEAAPQNEHASQEVGALQATGRSESQRASMTPQQQSRIRVLCERLGESEPDYASMTYEGAEQVISHLQLSEEELLLMADGTGEQDAESPTDPVVSRTAVGTLKGAWISAYRISGSKAIMRATWEKFKADTCKVEIDDDAMLSSQHDQLLAAIVAEEERRAPRAHSHQETKTPHANGQAR